MRGGCTIAVIIPALNEATAIGPVIAEIPAWVDQILVVDNGSTDATAQAARRAGAQVVDAPHKGYGRACLAGIAALDACDLVVFLDGDHSDYPAQMDRLVDPLLAEAADLVIGTRAGASPGALMPAQRLGNWLICHLMAVIYRQNCSDLGPFRALRRADLGHLAMREETFGWTLEMQIKAMKRGWRVLEVPVSYRPRIGQSKISGTIKGTLAAGIIIPVTFLRLVLAP